MPADRVRYQEAGSPCGAWRRVSGVLVMATQREWRSDPWRPHTEWTSMGRPWPPCGPTLAGWQPCPGLVGGTAHGRMNVPVYGPGAGARGTTRPAALAPPATEGGPAHTAPHKRTGGCPTGRRPEGERARLTDTGQGWSRLRPAPTVVRFFEKSEGSYRGCGGAAQESGFGRRTGGRRPAAPRRPGPADGGGVAA